MAQLNTDLEALKTARDSMKVALEGKGQTVTKDIRTYAEAISNISTGGGDIKVFETVEEMQADTSPQENDLAIVYRDDLLHLEEDTVFSSCTFPNEVVLDKVVVIGVNGLEARFNSVEVGNYSQGYASMTTSSFNFNFYTETGSLTVTYTSQDGLTYTRTDGGDAKIEFGTQLKWSSQGGYWVFDDVFGKFMLVDGKYFGGMFEYQINCVDNTQFRFPLLSGLNKTIENKEITSAEITSYYPEYFSVDYIKELTEKIKTDLGSISNNINPAFYINNNDELCFVWNGKISAEGANLFFSEDGSSLIGVGDTYSAFSETASTYKINRADDTYTKITDYTPISFSWGTIPRTGYYIPLTDIKTFLVCYGDNYSGDGDGIYWGSMLHIENENDYYYFAFSSFRIYNAYNNIKSQLNAKVEDVYGKTFYGKNGVGVGALTNNCSIYYDDINAKLFNDIYNTYLSAPRKVTLKEIQDRAFRWAYFIPTDRDGNSLLDFGELTTVNFLIAENDRITTLPPIDVSKVTNFFAFLRSPSIENIPVFDFSSVGSDGLWDSVTAPKLTDESLNNFMLSCVSASGIATKYRTLKRCGISSSQAARCVNLSNYSAFTSAGWTTGY